MLDQNKESEDLIKEPEALTTATPGQDPLPEVKMGYSEEVERPIEDDNKRDDKAPEKSLRE